MHLIPALLAALELLAPVGGKEIPLLPECQITILTNATLAARQAIFDADRANGKKLRHDPAWRQSRPLVLGWRATDGDAAPYKILIGRKADLADARVWYVRGTETVKADGSHGFDADKAKGAESFTVPYANLEIGATYFWQVCTKKGKSQVCSFTTAPLAPRWIEIEGRVKNIRDLGGRIGSGGRRVKQGLAYRGQGLNDNSVMGDRKGRNRLMVEDVEYFTKTLGIRTDLDLRSGGETADLAASPLGPSVRFIQHASPCYRAIFDKKGKETMAENFRVFCKAENYPIYFHCIAGADRTGSLAYVLNGVLGVSRQELETDWESTFYPRIPDFSEKAKKDPENYWCMERHFSVGFAKYGGPDATWNERIVLYLKDCGITDAEIAAFRELMLER